MEQGGAEGSEVELENTEDEVPDNVISDDESDGATVYGTPMMTLGSPPPTRSLMSYWAQDVENPDSPSPLLSPIRPSSPCSITRHSGLRFPDPPSASAKALASPFPQPRYVPAGVPPAVFARLCRAKSTVALTQKLMDTPGREDGKGKGPALDRI